MWEILIEKKRKKNKTKWEIVSLRNDNKSENFSFKKKTPNWEIVS